MLYIYVMYLLLRAENTKQSRYSPAGSAGPHLSRHTPTGMSPRWISLPSLSLHLSASQIPPSSLIPSALGRGRFTKSFKTTQFHPFPHVQSSVPAQLNWEPPTGVKKDYLYTLFMCYVCIFKYDICIFSLLLARGLCAGGRAAEGTLGEANTDPAEPCDPVGEGFVTWHGRSWVRDSQ